MTLWDCRSDLLSNCCYGRVDTKRWVLTMSSIKQSTNEASNQIRERVNELMNQLIILVTICGYLYKTLIIKFMHKFYISTTFPLLISPPRKQQNKTKQNKTKQKRRRKKKQINYREKCSECKKQYQCGASVYGI